MSTWNEKKVALTKLQIKKLKKVIAGQSLNLAYWADNVLESGVISESDSAKLERL